MSRYGYGGGWVLPKKKERYAVGCVGPTWERVIPKEQEGQEMLEMVKAEPAVIDKPIQNGWTREQVELIKSTTAKGATDEELQLFLYVANKYNLDPLTKEIFFVKRQGEMSIQPARDGFLKAAKQDPGYDGLVSFVVCEGDEFSVDAQRLEITHKFGSKRGKILGAWAMAHHKSRRPVVCYVPFDEYNQGGFTWKTNPSAMIQKVAEAFVLRRQFGLSGLYAPEEMPYTAPELAKTDGAEIPHDSVTGEIIELPFFNCGGCENTVQDEHIWKTIDGKRQQLLLFDYTLGKYGKRLCKECAKAYAEAQKNVAAVEHPEQQSDLTEEQQSIVDALADAPEDAR